MSSNKRNWIETLKPKGVKSGHNGSSYVMTNGHMIFGLKMALKAPMIIYDVELGKPYVPPKRVGLPPGITKA